MGQIGVFEHALAKWLLLNTRSGKSLLQIRARTLGGTRSLSTVRVYHPATALTWRLWLRAFLHLATTTCLPVPAVSLDAPVFSSHSTSPTSEMALFNGTSCTLNPNERLIFQQVRLYAPFSPGCSQQALMVAGGLMMPISFNVSNNFNRRRTRLNYCARKARCHPERWRVRGEVVYSNNRLLGSGRICAGNSNQKDMKWVYS